MKIAAPSLPSFTRFKAVDGIQAAIQDAELLRYFILGAVIAPSQAVDLLPLLGVRSKP